MKFNKNVLVDLYSVCRYQPSSVRLVLALLVVYHKNRCYRLQSMQDVNLAHLNATLKQLAFLS